MTDDKIVALASLVRKSAEGGTLLNIVFHAPRSGDALKAKGILRAISGNVVLQIETSLTEGRVRQKNCLPDQIEAAVEDMLDTFSRVDLNDEGGSASLMISKKGAVTLLKKGKIGERMRKSVAVAANDREKKHLLDGSEPFLTALGVSDENGRVYDKRQSKFRQICRFAEYIADAEKKLAREGELYVCDLCCGKSYLSFAAYHVLTAICGRRVHMSCVDLKQSVMDYCADIAEDAHMDGMSFVYMDINDFVPERRPDLVISLHACDTATDAVLDFAVRHRADAILSTPCCHHQMNRELDCPTLDFIGCRPILRQKLCDAATDALRLLMLESEGYRVDATELIDPEDTPKNVMLRAFRVKSFAADSPSARDKREKYRDTYKFLYGKYPD